MDARASCACVCNESWVRGRAQLCVLCGRQRAHATAATTRRQRRLHDAPVDRQRVNSAPPAAPAAARGAESGPGASRLPAGTRPRGRAARRGRNRRARAASYRYRRAIAADKKAAARPLPLRPTATPQPAAPRAAARPGVSVCALYSLPRAGRGGAVAPPVRREARVGALAAALKGTSCG